MVLFSAALVAFAAAVGVITAPVEGPAEGPTDFAISKRSTPNSSGTNGGFYYQFWTDGGGGSATYTNKAAGEYSVTWNRISDMTSGKGWKNATPRNITFTGTVNAQGNFYLAIYTWSQHGENYILENYGNFNPCSQGRTVGSITTDGSSYQICTVDRGGNYIQNWSIRQKKRSSGTVTTANHYNAYAAHGLNHNPLSQAAYQIVSTEGFQSSGSADITVKEAE